ncbi:MAG: hypothetical protein ACI9NQ_000334 [Paracoccaceae bacterium]
MEVRERMNFFIGPVGNIWERDVEKRSAEALLALRVLRYMWAWLFLGLVMNSAPDEEVPEGYELRELPRRQVVRLSGANRSDGDGEVEAVKRYADQKEIALDFENPAQLSGQSFSHLPMGGHRAAGRG